MANTETEKSEMELKVGDILWHMVGRRQNDTLTWYAKPECIETVDKWKYMFGSGGCSKNSVGIDYHLTREEAINHHLEHFGALVEKVDINKPISDFVPREKVNDVFELPRTDFEDLVITKWDTVNVAAVYVGMLGEMVPVTDEIEWMKEAVSDFVCEYLPLKNIREQVYSYEKYDHKIITVFQEGPLDGVIFQCGNAPGTDKWFKQGSLRGYA